jgi:hypothetical protein
MTQLNIIDSIITQFRDAYPLAYKGRLDEADGSLTLDAFQRSEMENELLERLVPKDPEVLIDIIIAIPSLFVEEMPSKGLFDISPAMLVRYNLMARARIQVADLVNQLEAEAFKGLDATKLHAVINEAVDMLRTVKAAAGRAELVAAHSSLRDFKQSADGGSFDNLITDASGLSLLLEAAGFTRKAKELDDVLRFVAGNRQTIVTN